MTQPFITQSEFQNLSSIEIAEMLRQAGTYTCVSPINGTRRWFMLEHAHRIQTNPLSAYLEIAGQNHLALYQLLFEHGIQTLVTPEFGPDLLERGDEYMEMSVEGMKYFVQNPDFLSFYEKMGVRVRFYGDYRQFFNATPYAYLSELFDDITQKTLHHTQHLLLIGICAHDATETLAALAIDYHQQHGQIPSKIALIEAYYGEAIAPASLYISFGKPTVFDMPLLSTGSEDLYFTLAPSPYLTQPQLRAILYDHLYSRREPETDYSAMNNEDWAMMRDFYHRNRQHTLGVGAMQSAGNYWYPLPQVELPEQFI